jgi:hypothetical protein
MRERGLGPRAKTMGRGGRYAVAGGQPCLTGDSALKASSSSPVGRHSDTPAPACPLADLQGGGMPCLWVRPWTKIDSKLFGAAWAGRGSVSSGMGENGPMQEVSPERGGANR